MKDYEQVYNGDADYSFSSSSPWSNCDDIKSVIIESGVPVLENVHLLVARICLEF